MTISPLFPSLFRYKSWANDELFAVALSIDAQQNPKAIHTATRVLNHLYVVDCIFKANLQAQKHRFTANNTPETPTLSDLYLDVQIMDDWYINYVSNLTEQALAEVLNFTFTDGKNGSMSRQEMLAHIITHSNYHRGAVGQILSAAGGTAPRDIFTRFLHEQEPQRRRG